MTFTAVTYNILAQAYTLPDRYPLSPPETLQPSHRRPLLLDRVAALDADLYCLQEVEPDTFDAIADRLGPAYHPLYTQKHNKPDGAALFLRRAAFTLTHHETLHYRDVDPGYDHLALIARARHTASALELTVASTHLRWQRRGTPPETHQGRLQLLQLLDHIAGLHPDTPALIAGDLNALSDGPVIRAALDRGLRLSCRSQRPWDTVNIDGRRRKLDYLLYSPERLQPAPGTLPKLQRDTPMPSHTEPSDHLPVFVRYTVTP